MHNDVEKSAPEGADEREEDRREAVTAADDTGLLRQQELLHVVEEDAGESPAS
jgi:hypothetical protein